MIGQEEVVSTEREEIQTGDKEKKLFTVRTEKHRLLGEVVDAPPLGPFKVRLDQALSTWSSCECPCSLLGSWTR